jgi:hypothetical protein
MGQPPHNVALTMTKEQFLQDLYHFMETKGQPITKVPSLGYQDLDLFHLYKLVIAHGGMDEVTRKQEWKSVYQDLGIPTMSTSASYNTRTNYKKYLYLYELEHCDFDDQVRPPGKEPLFAIGQYIRIVSQVYEGQVFYAQIVKYRFRANRNAYYVHYNGWSSSHDEWMPEEVLGPLVGSEQDSPENLVNPAPSRSSKSNRIIEEPLLVPGERPLLTISGPGSRVSSGQTTPKMKRKNNDVSSSGLSGEDEFYEDGNASVDVDQRRSSSLSLRNQKAINNILATLISPLDRAPLTPDWDLVRQEMLESELDNKGENQMTIREFHVNHNAHSSVPQYREFVDIEELKFMEENVFDFEPGKVMLAARLEKVKQANKKTESNVNPAYADPRSLEEIRQSVETLEAQLQELHRQYKRNSRLLSRMKTDPSVNRGRDDTKAGSAQVASEPVPVTNQTVSLQPTRTRRRVS